MSEKSIKQMNREYSIFPYVTQADADGISFERGEGVYLYDSNGKKYLDMASQFVNVNIGYGNEKVIEAAHEQMKRLHYVKPTEMTDIRGKLCEKIIREIAPPGMVKIFLTLGGSDANDFAVRIAKSVTGRKKILSQYYSYHGATVGATNLCGSLERVYDKLENKDFIHFQGVNATRFKKYFPDESSYCDFLLEMLDETILMEDPKDVAGIFFETMTFGDGNIIIPPKRYYEGVRKLCDKHGILLIFDEVLVGFGRTGKWFACEHYGVWPDIITFAKGVTSSYMPLGGVMVNKKVSDVLDTIPFRGTLTASYHPVSCAAAYACITYMQEEHLIEHSNRMGVLLRSLLEQHILPHPYVKRIRGVGLMQSIVLKGPLRSKNVCMAFEKMLEDQGICAYVDSDVITFTPPIVISEEQLDMAVLTAKRILDQMLEQHYAERIPDGISWDPSMRAFFLLDFSASLKEQIGNRTRILLLGSAEASVIRIVAANLRTDRKDYRLLASRKLFEQLGPAEQERCFVFEEQRFNAETQEKIFEKAHASFAPDCILMPYMRSESDWDNILDVAQKFSCPILRITRDGKLVER